MSLDLHYLRDMLSQDSHAIGQLKTALAEERKLLEERQLQGMQEIVALKDHLLGILSFNAKARAQLLQAAGLETSFTGWEALLLRDAATRSFIPEWQKVTQDFIECQEANEINGRMINRSKQTLTHLLNIIRGQVAAPSLYTPKGGTTSQGSTYTVAKA